MSQIERSETPPKLYIRKFRFDIPRSELKSYFEQFGPIKEIDFKNSTGFLEYEDTESFNRCLNSKHEFNGHEITVDTGYKNFSRLQTNSNRNSYDYNINNSRDNCKFCSNCPEHGSKNQIRINSDSLKLVIENIPLVENKNEIDIFLEKNFAFNINYSQLVKDNTMYICEFSTFEQKQIALQQIPGTKFNNNILTARIYVPPKENFNNKSRDYDRTQHFNHRGSNNRIYSADKSTGVDLYSDVNESNRN